MKSFKAERRLYFLLNAIALIACAGMFLLIIQAQSFELALFELMAFSVSITAVTLAALGAINNIQQRRVMQRIAREVHEAIKELKGLHKDSEAIQHALQEDPTVFAKEIAEVLAETGLIHDDSRRRAVAGDIEQKVRRRVKRQQ